MDFDQWLSLATAIGTVGAAVFAGVAAWIAGRSAGASRDLVTLERDRDRAAREAAQWRQARRITVEARGRKCYDDSDKPVGLDSSLLVTNASTDPIFKVRIKLFDGEAQSSALMHGSLPTSTSGPPILTPTANSSRSTSGRVASTLIQPEGVAMQMRALTRLMLDGSVSPDPRRLA